MIYITGDTHGLHKDYLKLLPYINNLGAEDTIIIAGDFGGVWMDAAYNSKIGEYMPNPYDTLNLASNYPEDGPTILFVDGNHDNHRCLNKLPIVNYKGGRAHMITSNIYHLMRGEIFTIEGKTFLTIGGALSIDKYYRTQNIDWWEEETITKYDIENAMENLAKHDFSIDYIITHTVADTPLKKLAALSSIKLYPAYDDQSTHFLEIIHEKVNFKKWYFGHFHVDINIDSKYICLYNNVVEIS